MGTTIRRGKLDPYEVRKEVDNYENTSLFDNMFINGKQVGARKARRERRREQAQQKRQPLLETNLQKSSDMLKKAPKQASLVNNNENIKQAAFLKLATIKLAIRFIQRNRGMSKQADTGNQVSPYQSPTVREVNKLYNPGWMNRSLFNPRTSQGSTSSANTPTNVNPSPSSSGDTNVIPTQNNAVDAGSPGAVPLNTGGAGSAVNNQSTSSFYNNWFTPFNSMLSLPNRTARAVSGQIPRLPYVRSAKEIRQGSGTQGPNIKWNKDNSTYSVEGDALETGKQKLLEERSRIDAIWNSMSQEEKIHYGMYYNQHIADLDKQIQDIDNKLEYTPTEQAPTPADPRVVTNDPRVSDTRYSGFYYNNPDNVHSILEK